MDCLIILEPRRPPLPPGSQNQIKRRVVKRLRPKNGTLPVDSSKGFVVTGSTLRPVTRINVKTKLGGKISTTYRTTEITEASSPSSFPPTTTTEEPELITASDDVVQDLRQRATFPPPTPSNNSQLIIKVVSERPHPVSVPISIKKPILSGPLPGKKLRPRVVKKFKSNNSRTFPGDEENQTKSPDYDYAYYNSEDAIDYDQETSKIDHKNFGSKPTKH